MGLLYLQFAERASIAYSNYHEVWVSSIYVLYVTQTHEKP